MGRAGQGGVKLLLDTHALIWWLLDDARLPARTRIAIANPGQVAFVSAVSAYEIAQKHRLGKLPEAGLLAAEFDTLVAAEGFAPLPLASAEARLAGAMSDGHRDPFDRMLAAQALLNDLTIISSDSAFDAFGVARIW